jgi:hypothetical protein
MTHPKQIIAKMEQEIDDLITSTFTKLVESLKEDYDLSDEDIHARLEDKIEVL